MSREIIKKLGMEEEVGKVVRRSLAFLFIVRPGSNYHICTIPQIFILGNITGKKKLVQCRAIRRI